MILFFREADGPILAVKTFKSLTESNIQALKWLFSGAEVIGSESIKGLFNHLKER